MRAIVADGRGRAKNAGTTSVSLREQGNVDLVPYDEEMTSPILQTVPLGFQWQTVDPFLFCVHHLDHYPAATAELGPGGVAGGSPARTGLRSARRLADVPRPGRAGLPGTSAPRLRDGHVRAPGPRRPLGLARRCGSVRTRRRPVDDGRQRHRPQRDVPAARSRRPQHHGAVPDLDQPAGRRQDGRRPLLDVLGSATSRATSTPTRPVAPSR